MGCDRLISTPPLNAKCRRFLDVLRLGAAFSAVLGGGWAPARAEETNYWPVWVGQGDSAGGPATIRSWTAAGPFAFYKPIVPGPGEPSTQAGGIRPFWVWKKDDTGETREAFGLYPLFTYRTSLGGARRWSVFNLINRSVISPLPVEADHGRTEDGEAFDVWPFYFSLQTGNPEIDYRAVFPIAGTIKRRLGYDRLSWTLFPLYGRFEKKGMVRDAYVWPFVKVTHGEGHRGFELWPLFGRRERPGDYRNRFAVWPLFYWNESRLDQPQPDLQFGALPFYARDRSEGYASETWVWPFFGYVDRTVPYRYHARNYFWPFLVQGRGDNRRVNRWAPFYTYSNLNGTEKRWILWPLWREQSWRDGDVDQTRRQLLYFLYNSTVQTSVRNPSAEPANKTHLWPLWSSWDNGAGRRQVQVLSPFEVFFPHNEPMRLVWSPLFALYRYDQQPGGEVRHSLFWDAITWRREPTLEEREFHLGPLFSVESGPGSRRIALGSGLVGLQRDEERGWRFFFGQFKRSSRQPASADLTP